MLFRSSATATADDVFSVDVALPAGAQEGDLLEAACISESIQSTFITPDGWQLVDNGTTGGAANPSTCFVFRKIVEAGDTGPFTFAIVNEGISRNISAGIACYQDGAGSLVDATLHLNDGGVASTTITAPDVTTTADNALVARIFCGGNTTVTADTPALEARMRFDVIASASQRRLHYCDEDQAVAGATGTETATQGNTLGWQGFTVSTISAPSAEETLNPDAILAQTNLSGVLGDVWLVI